MMYHVFSERTIENENVHSSGLNQKTQMMVTLFWFVITILLTWVLGYLDGSTPYFPIEISRTATGPWSGWAFYIGIAITSSVFLYQISHWSNREKSYMYVSMFGLLLLAWVDDVKSWAGHMIGLAIMGTGTITFVFMERPNHIGLIICAGGLWIVRLFMKIAIVAIVEQGGNPFSISTYWNAIMGGVKQDIINIMYTGHTNYPDTLLVFKITGILQWLVFAMIIPIYTST